MLFVKINEGFVSSGLDELFQGFEQTLNVFGYIPFISTASSYVRHSYGTIQVTAGIAFAILSSLSQNNDRQAEHGVEIAIHGFTNMCRATVEAIPFINLITIPYDIVNRFEYQSLKHRCCRYPQTQLIIINR
jgi:hypothetical protein